MTRTLKIIVLYALTATATSTFGQHRCQINGNTIYQDEPCRNAARRSETMPPPRSDTSPALPAPAVQSAARPSDMERQKAYLATQENTRRRDAIKDEIALLEEQNITGQQKRDAALDALQYRKAHATNNLAGATLEHGLATEMQAVTERYAADQSTRNERIRHLREELARLK